MGVRPGGEEQACVALLADEQVGEVDLGRPVAETPETVEASAQS